MVNLASEEDEDGDKCIKTEHQLCRCGTRSSVHNGAHCLASCTQHFFPKEVFIEILFATDVSGAKHVSHHGFAQCSVAVCLG